MGTPPDMPLAAEHQAASHPLDEPQAGGRAIRGAALRMVSYGTGALVGVITVPLVIRHLGLEEFGRYSVVVALVATVGGLTEAGLGPIGVREYALLEGRERDRFMRNFLGLRLAFTLLGAVVAAVFALAVGYERDQVIGTIVAAGALLVVVTQFTFAVPLHAELRLGRQVAAELAGHVSAVALVLVIVAAGGGMVVLLAAGIPTALLVLAITVAFVRGSVPMRPSFELGRWRAVLRDTLPVGLATAVHTLYFRSVIILMSLVAADIETGYFATSYRLTEVLIGIPVVLVTTTFPVVVRAAHSDEARLVYATRRLFETGIVAGGLMVGVIVLAAPLAIQILAGDEGEPSVPVLRVQAITVLLAFLSATFGVVLLSVRRHRELATASFVALGVTLALAGVLVPAEGAVGGAVAATGGELALVLALGTLLYRSERGLQIPLGVLPKAAVAGAVAAAVGLAAPGGDAVAAPLFAVVYVGLLAALRAIPPEIHDALLKRR